MQKSTVNSQSPCIGSMPWWVSSGSQEYHVNSTDLNQFHWVGENQKTSNYNYIKSHRLMDEAPEKEKEAAFPVAFSAGESKNSFKEGGMHCRETNSFQQVPPPLQKGYIELELGQPMVYANYPVGDQCHGSLTAYGTYPMGSLVLPFSATTEDGPIYVNPKQYYGILRRRKMRAKEGLKSKLNKEKFAGEQLSVKKPYLHESRHRHACRRPRGADGRFLNTKSSDTQKNELGAKQPSEQPLSESLGSEVLQSESVNLNSSKEVSDSKSSNLSSTEVSTMFYSKEFDYFGVNSARPFAFHPLSNMDGNRQGSNWVATPDCCCDFFKI